MIKQLGQYSRYYRLNSLLKETNVIPMRNVAKSELKTRKNLS